MTTAVTFSAARPGGGDPAGIRIRVRLLGDNQVGGVSEGGRQILGEWFAELDHTGTAVLNLVPTDTMTPAGCFYICETDKIRRYLQVPTSPTSITWTDPTWNLTLPTAPELLPTQISGTGGGGAVDSVNGQTGVVVLAASDVGAATPADISTAVAPLATSSSVTTGLAGKVDTTDGRLTDTRTPTDGSVTNAKVATGAAIALSKLATDPLARANHTGTQSADTITDGTTNKAYTATEQTKLSGVATGATANSSDAVLEARANHTGTQAVGTITGLGTAATKNVGTASTDVAAGDTGMTSAERTKLSGVATGATANATDAQLRDRSTHTGTQSADTLTDGTTNKAFLATERTKLTGIATGATANSSDAVLEARANHTGTQSADTITDGTTNKAYTATEKTKLAGVATGATANSTDAVLEARANHTGTQAVGTITGLGTSATVDTGTGATNVILGNDARLTDTRTPTDGTVTTAKIVDANVTTAKLAASSVTEKKVSKVTIPQWTSTGQVTANLGTEYILSNPAAESNGATPSWTKSVASGRLRFTGLSTNTTNGINTRIWHVGGSSMLESEVLCLWYGRDGDGQAAQGRGQFGVVHRAQIDGSTGRPWGYISWHDIAFGQDDILNTGKWEADATLSTTMAITATNSASLDIAKKYNRQYLRNQITQVSLTTNVATIWLDNADQFWKTGDAIAVSSAGAAGLNIGTLHTSYTGSISTVDSQKITYAKTNANITAATTDVLVGNVGRKLPMWVRSRCTGTGAATTITAKIWPVSAPEPSWSDPTATWSWTDSTQVGPSTSAGLCGVDIGHLSGTGSVAHWLEIGQYEARSLD